MQYLLRRVVEQYRTGGLDQVKESVIGRSRNELVQGYDNRLRVRFPRRLATYNGVRTRGARLFDGVVPWHERDVPSYEYALVKAIREHISPGDSVVIVGGGWGVSTVAAAQQAGPEGSVWTFEGASERVRNVHETLSLNDVPGSVTVHRATVGPVLRLEGTDSGKRVAPTDLPDCDVLVADCEGAELELIEGTEADPRTILVETHGYLGAAERDVRELLEDRGYEVLSSEIAEPRVREVCEERDIMVLTATISENRD